MLPQCQNNRWIGIFFIFMMSALSMCTFQGEQHEMSEFPARKKDRLGELLMLVSEMEVSLI